MKTKQAIKCFVHFADELESVTKLAQAQSAQLDKLQNEVAKKEKAEGDLQLKLTGIQNENAQLKEFLQKKEGKYFLNEALCEKHTDNQQLCTLCR